MKSALARSPLVASSRNFTAKIRDYSQSTLKAPIKYSVSDTGSSLSCLNWMKDTFRSCTETRSIFPWVFPKENRN